MVKVKFNPKGGPLKAKAIFLGDMIADYAISLKDATTNNQTLLLEGDNLNPEDDSVQLPTPSKVNNKRRLKLKTAYVGNHPDQNSKYEIRLEVFQDGKLLGFENETNDEESKLTNKAQISLLLITLMAQ